MIATDTLTHGMHTHIDHVLMYGIPSDMTTFGQRLGRVNRHKGTGCTALVAFRNVNISNHMRCFDNEINQQTHDCKVIERMLLDFTTCRHVQLSKFFNSKSDMHPCKTLCDVCTCDMHTVCPETAEIIRSLLHIYLSPGSCIYGKSS